MPDITMENKRAGKGTYHVYRVHGDPKLDPKKELPSISTIAKHADTGGPGLLTWAARLAIEHNDVNAHQTVGAEAQAIGAELHSNIDEYIKTKKQPTEPSPLFGLWYSSLNERGVEFWGSEVMVYHPDGYAGTIDAIGHVNGVPTLFDWKTTDEFSYKKDKDGNFIYKENGQIDKDRKYLNNNNTHASQVAGYMSAIKYMAKGFEDMPQPRQAFIVYVFKDTKRVQWMKVNLDKATRVFKASHTIYAVEHTPSKLFESGVI